MNCSYPKCLNTVVFCVDGKRYCKVHRYDVCLDEDDDKLLIHYNTNTDDIPLNNLSREQRNKYPPSNNYLNLLDLIYRRKYESEIMRYIELANKLDHSRQFYYLKFKR